MTQIDHPGTLSSDTASRRRNLLVFRNVLLPYSETFVLEQSEACRRYAPHYVGLRQATDLPVPASRTIVLSNGGQPGWRRLVAEQLFKRVGLAPAFHRRLRQAGPVLVHAHFGPCAMLARVIARKLHVPLVVQFHGYDATADDEFLLTQGFAARQFVRNRHLLEYGHTLLLAVSSFIKDSLVRKGMDPKLLRVHYIGVDADRFVPDPAAANAQPDDVVLFVGRLVPKKGLPDLIAAMQIVARRHPEARLVVIGEGPMRRECEGVAAALGHCVFLGKQPPEVVLKWMQRARVFCAPSRTAPNGDCEGLPISLLEAQACGLPVVSTRHAGIPEAVQHGATGLLAGEGDVAGLALGITRLLDQPDERAALGSAARSRIISQFNLREQSFKLEAMYDRLLSRFHAAGHESLRSNEDGQVTS